MEYRNFSPKFTPTCRCKALKLHVGSYSRVLELGVRSTRLCSIVLPYSCTAVVGVSKGYAVA